MSENKKAPTSAATLTGAVGNGPVSQTAHVSTKNHTISAEGRQGLRIAALLLHGEQNALPMKHLKAVTDLSSREIRIMIQRERFVKSMRHRSAEIARVADAVEQAEV